MAEKITKLGPVERIVVSHEMTTAWRTRDNRSFSDEEMALAHEKKLDAQEAINQFPLLPSNAEDWYLLATEEDWVRFAAAAYVLGYAPKYGEVPASYPVAVSLRFVSFSNGPDEYDIIFIELKNALLP